MKLLILILLFTTNAWAGQKFGCPKVLVEMTKEDKSKPWFRGRLGLGDENSVRQRCTESGVFKPQPGFEGEFGPEELEEYLANSDAKIDGVSDKFLQQCLNEKGIGFKETEDQRAVVADYYSLNNRLKEGGATLVEALQSVENTIAPEKGGEWNNIVKKLTKNSFIPGVEALSKEVTECKVTPAQREQNLKSLKATAKQAVESVAVINEKINAIRCTNVKNDYQCDEKKLDDGTRQNLELLRTMKSSILGSSPILANEKLSRFVVETGNVKKNHFKKNANGGLDIADQADFDKTIEDHLRDSRDQMASELRKFSIAAKCLNDENSNCSSSELAANIKTLPPANDFFTKKLFEAQNELNAKNASCATGNCIADPSENLPAINVHDPGFFKKNLRDINAANSAMNSAACRGDIRTNHSDADKVIFDSAVNLGLTIPTGGFALVGRGLLKGSGYLMKGVGSANRVVESAALVKIGNAGGKVIEFAPKITSSYAPLYFGHNAANLTWGIVGLHEGWDLCHESYTNSVVAQANEARKTKAGVCDQNVKAAIPNQQLQSCLMTVAMGALNLIPFAPMAYRGIVNKLNNKNLLGEAIPVAKNPLSKGGEDLRLSKTEGTEVKPAGWDRAKDVDGSTGKANLARVDEPQIVIPKKNPNSAKTEPTNVEKPNESAKAKEHETTGAKEDVKLTANKNSSTSAEAGAQCGLKGKVPSPFFGRMGTWLRGFGTVMKGIGSTVVLGSQIAGGVVGIGGGAYGAYEANKSKSPEEAAAPIILTEDDRGALNTLKGQLAEWTDPKTGLKNPPPEFTAAIHDAQKVLEQKLGELDAAKNKKK
jgi:hypothetical protein